jgi:ketosteroid isomerase-like protein
MSEENLELVKRGWEAYESGDLSAALVNLSPDMVTHVAAPIPVAGTYHGREGFLQVTLDWAEGFDELVVTGEEFVDTPGDKVMVRARHRGSGVGSGVPVETDVWYVFTIRKGKTVRVDITNDRAGALEAAAPRK